MATATGVRLTQHARGGGCACKIPPGELEAIVASLGELPERHRASLVVGLDHGDDAAVVGLDRDRGIVSTADFFAPVVDDAFDWGRIAAANALSDVYAMGGTPLVALNLLTWPRDTLPVELAAEVLAGARAIADEAGCLVAGGHSIDGPEPVFGMAVTGLVDLDVLLTLDAGEAGLPLSLSKPLGIGVLNTRHKVTGEVSAEALATMTTLNAAASVAAVAAGIRCATDVTGFGLLGHLKKLALASGVSAVIDRARIAYLEGARQAVADGHVSGGTRRNLEWVRDDTDLDGVPDDEALLLADAQTSGGLLVVGEIPGAPVIGELVARTDHLLSVR